MTMSHSQASTAGKLRCIRDAIMGEYSCDTQTPWVVAFSGGKDSTLLLQLVWESVACLEPERRHRRIYVIANDTLVESPLVREHMYRSIEVIKKSADAQSMPITAEISRPYDDQTFWVNVIGRGYAPPTRNFRWCTDRMKIQPTELLLTEITEDYGESLLLIGTRRAESSQRRRNMDKYGVDATESNPHNSVAGCRVMAPLADLEDNDVWRILTQRPSPWGGDHRHLITLYKNAGGGDCPLVLTKSDAPSCGSSSPRFGCWTCTVVKKDRSLLGTIAAGDPEANKLIKMADFRDYLIAKREDDNARWPFRRDGVSKVKNGNFVRGPFKLRVRKEILEELRQLEADISQELLSATEEKIIYEIWRVDRMKDERAEALV